MDEARPTPRPIVLCPLRFECHALSKADLGARCEIVQIGPGAAAIVRWAERFGESSRLVVLAGLAGSLRPTFAPGAAAVISGVIDRTGQAQVAAFGHQFTDSARGEGIARAVIASSPRVLTTAAGRRDLAARSGADLVDQESAAFALAGRLLGWRWAIVRGVSDGHEACLPAGVDRWVNDQGEANPMRVIGSLLRRPWEVPAVIRLAGDSRVAMARVAAIVGRVLDHAAGPGRVDSAAM